MTKTTSNTAKARSTKEIALLLESIARDHLLIESLEIQHSDRLDFHEVSIWGVKAALQAAFDAGRQSAIANSTPTPIHTPS